MLTETPKARTKIDAWNSGHLASKLVHLSLVRAEPKVQENCRTKEQMHQRPDEKKVSQKSLTQGTLGLQAWGPRQKGSWMTANKRHPTECLGAWHYPRARVRIQASSGITKTKSLLALAEYNYD